MSTPNPQIQPRPSLAEYLMALAVEVASRSNCIKIHVGAIFLFDGRIRATGYNGTVSGYADCMEGGCPRCRNVSIKGGQKLDYCVCVHAEENALVNAARHGIGIDKCECYVTHEPCLSCTKLLIQAGIKKVVYLLPYEYPEEADPQLDQNKTRNDMRKFSKNQPGGTEFIPFLEVMKHSDGAKKLAKNWEERLREMKREAKEYAEAKGLFAVDS